MFCPICKSEYREGFKLCVDCDSLLVEELPSQPRPEFVDYDEVLSTFNPADIAIVKSILDTTDIIYFFHGEHFGYMRPLALPARLMVRKDQVEDTSEILKDLNLSFTGVNLSMAKSRIGRLSDRAEFWIVLAIGYAPFLWAEIARIANSGFARVIKYTDTNQLDLVVFELSLAFLLGSFLYLRGWRIDHFNCRITLKDTGWGILLWLMVYGLYHLRDIAATSIPFLSSALTQVRFTGHVSLVAALWVSIVNPVFDEFLDLGFAIRSLESHGARFAVGASVILRLLCHIYQGPARMFASILPIGLLFGVFYWRTRRMWPLVVAHALTDFIALISLR